MGVFSLDIIAGALVAFAALPKILQRLRAQRLDGAKLVDYGDIQRDGLIIFGNIIWVFFGFREEIYGLVIFGSINVFFTTLLIAQSFLGQLSYKLK